MKRIIFSNPVKQYSSSGSSGLRQSRSYMMFCAVLFGGIIFGAVSSRNADIKLLQRLDFIFQTNFNIRCSQGLISAFVSSFASSVMLLTVVFLLGLSLWGGFISPVVPFFKGYGYGLSVGFLYGAYGLKGIFYNILVILPGSFISAAVIAAAALQAFRNSLRISACFIRTPLQEDPQKQMKGYFVSMLRALAMCAFSAVLDMLCSLCFSWIFNF